MDNRLEYIVYLQEKYVQVVDGGELMDSDGSNGISIPFDWYYGEEAKKQKEFVLSQLNWLI